MATKIGIVYSTNSKMLRSIIVPDYDGELDEDRACGPGESLLVVDRPDSHDMATCQALIKAHTGVDPPHFLCEVVHPGHGVVNVIHADPEIDKIRGHVLRHKR